MCTGCGTWNQQGTLDQGHHLVNKMYHKTMKQGAEIINSEPNVGNIEVQEAIGDSIGTEQEENSSSDLSNREGDNPRYDENNHMPDMRTRPGRVSHRPGRLEP